MARRSGTGSAGAGGSSGGSRGGGSSGGGSSGGGSSGGGSSGGASSGGSSRRPSSTRGQATTTTRTTGGTPATKTSTVSTTQRQTRTPTTLSAPAVMASKSTSQATGRVNPRATSKPITVSPPVSQLTGGRIAQNPVTPQSRTTALMSSATGGSMPVTVTFAGGQRQSMNLSTAAIKTYQDLGLHVTPVQQTFGGANPAQVLWDYTGKSVTGTAIPQIPRIVNPSIASDPNPPPYLHVNPNQPAKPNTRTNSNFGGLGANPWNPIEGILDLFNMSPQSDPQSQWLPQQEQNTQSLGYPEWSPFEPVIFNHQPAATQGAFNNTMMDPSQTIKNLFQNKWILYAGLALGAFVGIKIVMGLFGGRGSSGGGTKIYT